jgi:hypothetical protein
MGWGECTYYYNTEADICSTDYPEPAPKFRWSVTRVGAGAPAFTYEFHLGGPNDLEPDEL